LAPLFPEQEIRSSEERNSTVVLVEKRISIIAFYACGRISPDLFTLYKITNIFLLKAVLKHNYCNFAIHNR
jgi:hypothetical protein